MAETYWGKIDQCPEPTQWNGPDVDEEQEANLLDQRPDRYVCATCKGEGLARDAGDNYFIDEPCPDCDGDGVIVDE